MGCSWRLSKKLPKDQWAQYGYNKQVRSIGYNIGKGLMMQNFLGKGAEEKEGLGEAAGDGLPANGAKPARGTPGPYRARYDEAKAKAKEAHPDWTPGHCDLHAMLLATKLLVKHLWVAWNKKPAVDPRYGV